MRFNEAVSPRLSWSDLIVQGGPEPPLADKLIGLNVFPKARLGRAIDLNRPF
jgi:hypothetical protein